MANAIAAGVYPYKVVLSEQPALWSLYKTTTALMESPTEKSHLFLKGAWHALDRKEYRIAEEFARQAHDLSAKTFSAYVIDLELLKRQNREAEIPQKLLEIAEIFQRKGLPAQEVKAVKRLAQLQPTPPNYERVIALYTQAGKLTKAIEWTKMLGNLTPAKVAAPPALLSSSVQKLPDIAFGKDLWAKFFGDVGVEPPLPADIDKILEAQCPFWPDKKVKETHLLVLIPEKVTIGGGLLFGDKTIKLNLKTLGDLVQKPRQGNATKYACLDLGEYNDPPAPKSHWALMTRDVIKGSRNKSYQEQVALIKKPYEAPTILAATTCILMEYFRTGKYLYSRDPRTFTRCQEKYDGTWQLCVGGFAPGGLCVHDNFHNGGNASYGMGGLWKFF
jgi:hypothetical protein